MLSLHDKLAHDELKAWWMAQNAAFWRGEGFSEPTIDRMASHWVETQVGKHREREWAVS